MSNTVMFKIDTEGNLKCLHTPVTKAMFPEPASILRASHVEPVSLSLKIAFKALRIALGDEGKVAEWTRTWDCHWEVNLHPVMGPYVGPFATRQDAIDFEINWLNKNFLAV